MFSPEAFKSGFEVMRTQPVAPNVGKGALLAVKIAQAIHAAPDEKAAAKKAANDYYLEEIAA